MIDVLIPTIPERLESLERLTASLARTRARLNIVPIDNSETCGSGWKVGIAATTSEYVLLACDDQEFTDPDWADICVATVEDGYIPCPRVWTPDGSIESQGGDMNAMHHLTRTPQPDGLPVDYTTVPFLSREWADAIGMLDVHYCSDVWVSYRGRQLGIQTVLRHGFEVVHYQEAAGRGAGMSQVDRDAMDAATMHKALEEVAA